MVARGGPMPVFLRTCLVLLAGLACGLAAARPAAATTIEAVRTGNHAEMSRIVLDLSGDAGYRVFTLADPYRVVIDLRGARWDAGRASVPGALDHVKRLRHGRYRDNVARVVLDLAAPARVRRAFLLGPGGDAGHRFVVDLADTSRGAFMEQAGLDNPVADHLDGERASVQVAGADRPDSGNDAPTPGNKPHAPGERPTVVIDAGHGGKDPGAVGDSGVYEKNVTLAAAHTLEKLLTRTGRYDVVLTRDRDVFLTLRGRVEQAREADADLFLSLHADSIPDSPDIRGLHVYTVSDEASSAQAARLARRENRADIVGGVDFSQQSREVNTILMDLTRRETMNLSAEFADYAVSHLSDAGRLLNNSHRSAGFVVLKAPDIPSVLVELGYLSNPHEERLLRKASYRRKLMRALTEAVGQYFTRTQEAGRP